MGLFGPRQIEIAPHDFVKAELDQIFSTEFADAETDELARLSKDISILRSVSPDMYLRERRHVIVSLFQIAWDRAIPYPIFVEYASIIHDDPRVKAVDAGAYDGALSRAQEAGMDTFGFISSVFLTQILPHGGDAHQPDLKTLSVIFGTDFTSRYVSFESLIKRHRFVTLQ
jgi:hypothetical protein